MDKLQSKLFQLRPQVIVLLALQDIRLLRQYMHDLGPLVGNQIPSLNSDANVVSLIQLLSSTSSLAREFDDRGDTVRLSSLEASISRRTDVDGLSGKLILNFCQSQENSVAPDFEENLKQLELMGKMFMNDLKASSAFVLEALKSVSYSEASTPEAHPSFLQMKQAATILRKNN